MDLNKPWGWRPSKGSNVGNTLAPLGSFNAEGPGSIVIPESADAQAARAVGGAVLNEGLSQLGKDAAQDTLPGVTDAFAPLSGEAVQGLGGELLSTTGSEVAQEAGNELLGDFGKELAADSATEAASGMASNILPFAGTANALAEGNYLKAAANAAASATGIPGAGLAANLFGKVTGFYADGTTAVPSVPGQGGKGGAPSMPTGVTAPMSGFMPGASMAPTPATPVPNPTSMMTNRAAAGMRFAPELFGAIPGQGGKGSSPAASTPVSAPARAPVPSTSTFARTPLSAAPAVSSRDAQIAAARAEMEAWQNHGGN